MPDATTHRNSWEKTEEGWHTHPILGGICKEDDGYWYWYPLEVDSHVGGRFPRLSDAKGYAKRSHELLVRMTPPKPVPHA